MPGRAITPPGGIAATGNVHPESRTADGAAADPIATILMVAIVIVLAVLILVVCLGFLQIPEFQIASVPAIFIITNVIHVDDKTGHMNYDSRLIVKHTGSVTYDNSKLKATLYRNGKQLPAVIETLRATDFIGGSIHLGVQWIGHAGCSGDTWLPGEMCAIDVKDGTFRPGDTAQIDIIDKSSGEVISRHVYRVW